MAEFALVHPDAESYGGWSWDEPRGGEHFRRCSFCGSVSPVDLDAEPVWEASWSDQKYGWPHKFYVDIPNRDPDRVFVVGTSSGSSRPGEDPWVRVEDLTVEQRKILHEYAPEELMAGVTAVAFGTRPFHWGKFYSVHLSDPALDAELVRRIEKRAGIRFSFDLRAGRVKWERL